MKKQITRYLTPLGGLILFATFVVKDIRTDEIKEKKDSLDAAVTLFNLECDLVDISNQSSTGFQRMHAYTPAKFKPDSPDRSDYERLLAINQMIQNVQHYLEEAEPVTKLLGSDNSDPDPAEKARSLLVYEGHVLDRSVDKVNIRLPYPNELQDIDAVHQSAMVFANESDEFRGQLRSEISDAQDKFSDAFKSARRWSLIFYGLGVLVTVASSFLSFSDPDRSS